MRVTVIGEYCTDIFIYGESKRLSPEAPVPVFTPIEKTENPGMAGNVIENLKSLDNTINVSGRHQTNMIKKTRYVDKKTNHMFIRIDENDSSERINLNQSTINLIMNSDVVIVSDYDKGLLTIDDLSYIGKISRMSILDSKKVLTKEVINSYSFVKLNELEYKQNQHLLSNNIIVTLGSKGCMFNDKIFESPKPLETIDVSGAGDTFTASFILEYFKTKDIENSLKFANLMSSIVVSKRGVVTP
jgi:D-beta-D-heptose 7-phosphate kinase/D-beta-D-heptose 1-phosphate adenosyltransferase